MPNQFDVSIAANKYRFKRGSEEGKPYQVFSRRALVELQELEQLPGSQFASRADLRPVFQTSWAGGARWEKPLLSQNEISSYNVQQGFDLITEPGNLFPMPDATETAAPSSIAGNSLPLAVNPTQVYFFEATANIGLVLWDGSSYSVLTNDFGTTQVPLAMCWDAENSTVFAIFDNGEVRYVTPDSAGGLVRDIGSVYVGTNIFMSLGRLMVWTGDMLIEVTDPLGTDDQTTIYNDGLGPDALDAVTSGANMIWNATYGIRTGIATSEGIFLVKNVNQDGLVTPLVYRIDRDASGANIGTPLTTLPRGTACLDITHHLGSVLFSTATDQQKVFANNSVTDGFFPVTIYHFTGNSMGSVGTINGGISPDESPFRFLGAEKEKLFIGGEERIWVYDAVRGGVHPFYTSSNGGVWWGLVPTTNGTDNIFLGITQWSVYDVQIPRKDEGGNGETRQLDSNYIDFSMPAEKKTITHVTLMTDGISAGETWTLYVETDDGSFTSVATWTSADANTTVKHLGGGNYETGYRFRYRLAWTATGDISSPSRVKGIFLRAIQGEFQKSHTYLLDMNSIMSVENEVVRPWDGYNQLDDLMITETPVEVINYFWGVEQENTGIASVTKQMRVDTVAIVKDDSDEFVAQISVTEVNPT